MKKYSFIFVLLLVGYTEQKPHNIKQSVQESLQTLTNPFKHSTTQNLQLKAIINDKVLLNDEWYRLGDMIDGYTIIALQPQGIILQKSNTRFSLLLGSTLEKLEQ